MKKILLLPTLCLITLFSFAQQPTVGLILNDSTSEPGYVMFYPEYTTQTYLIDKCGYLVHTWTSDHPADAMADLLPDGTLLRPRGGSVIERLDWNSNILWSYPINNDTEYLSHETYPMPNGDFLVDVWEVKDTTEAINAGLNPSLLQGATSFIVTSIKEVKPIGTDSGVVVWQWNAWDHLIQDYDPTKANYGVVDEHPERININYVLTKPDNGNAIELLHSNAVDYNPTYNQVMLSSRNFSEFWIIDHSTTTAQAATDTGGVHGMGGGLLYRWGNSPAYGRGTERAELEFGQHNPHWIDSGYSGAGDILMFNNGYFRPGTFKYSEVDQMIPPVDSNGDYSFMSKDIYGPDSVYWKDSVPGFYSYAIGGVQRLLNGNTLIDDGEAGTFYEIDSNRNLVWEYINPVVDTGILYQGQVPLTANSITSESNNTFRCTLYDPSYSGLAGHDLTPTAPLERNPLNYTCETTTGINKKVTATGIKAVNPFSNSIVLFSGNNLSNLTATLTNDLGVVVKRWNNISINNGTNTLGTEVPLTNGIYFLHLNNTQFNTTIELVRMSSN